MLSRFSVLLPLIAALTLLAASACPAQVPPAGGEPQALSALRSSFELRARMASGVLNDYYERALSSLEATVSANGDYEQARAIKARREELAANGSVAASNRVNAIDLPVEAAKLVGGVTAKNGELSSWKTSASSVEWYLPKLAAGSYQLQLSYTMTDRGPDIGLGSARSPDPVPEAQFVVREVSLLATAAKNTRTLKFTMTKTAPQMLTADAPLEFVRPPVTLRLSASSSYPGNIITISKVALVPVAPNTTASPAAAPSAPVSLAAEWQQFQKAMPQRLAEARKPTVEAYTATLKAMLAKDAGNDELAAKIETEQRRAQRLIDDTSTRSPAGMKLDNFEDIDGAAFVPDPGNQGDKFKVEHQGRQFFVRLAWIACPPVDPSDRRRMKLASERFGADDIEALNLGRNAQEFTALYLEGRPLRMLLRQSKKHEDEIMALVFITDIGLFQSVLLDHGLAVVDPPPSLSPAGMEQGLFKGMQEREAAASKKKNPPGGWALKARQ